jgi:hypothetical protein
MDFKTDEFIVENQEENLLITKGYREYDIVYIRRLKSVDDCIKFKRIGKNEINCDRMSKPNIQTVSSFRISNNTNIFISKNNRDIVYFYKGERRIDVYSLQAHHVNDKSKIFDKVCKIEIEGIADIKYVNSILYILTTINELIILDDNGIRHKNMECDMKYIIELELLIPNEKFIIIREIKQNIFDSYSYIISSKYYNNDNLEFSHKREHLVKNNKDASLIFSLNESMMIFINCYKKCFYDEDKYNFIENYYDIRCNIDHKQIKSIVYIMLQEQVKKIYEINFNKDDTKYSDYVLHRHFITKNKFIILNVHKKQENKYLKLTFNRTLWIINRVIWIGFYKPNNNDGTTNIISILPKEIITHIITYLYI